MRTVDTHILPGLKITPKPHFLDTIARRAVHARLGRITLGEIILTDKNGTVHFGRADEVCALHAYVRVIDERFYCEMAFGGSIGAGEAYMQGFWKTDDLTVLMRILLLNREVLDGMETGLAAITVPLQKSLHWLSRNTREGSSRNIARHYDLGNDLFQLFLDPTMMYSSAVFDHPDMTLEQGSVAKLDSICRKIDLKPTDRLIEIGTGWGGFAIHAAMHYGCHVTTTTISRQQYELACKRVAAAGLNNRITLLLEDYRDLDGQYDKLVSIEMIEAVGYKYYDTYFAKCSALLKSDGLMLLQAITIADQQYETARKSVDFIQRHIFPGSCIPAVAVICDSIARVTDMRLINLQDIGPHYATTLRMWRENFNTWLAEVRKLGYSAEFIRMWEFYLCYCEAGFMERVIGDVHMLLTKPQARP
jgi:cyclopropane-fatty-acyl-phospholipid synthase